MSQPNLSLIINTENDKPIGISINDMKTYNDGDITISFVFAYKVMNEAISSNHLIVDVGADKGYFSYLSHAFLPDNQIYAFEPNPISYNKLIDTIIKQSNTIVLPLAISDKEETVKFTLSDSTTNCRDGGDVDIICKPLSNIIEKDRTIYFLKVDTEGHDLNVIKSASNFIESGCLHNIVFEYTAYWLGNNSLSISLDMFNYLHRYYKHMYALGRIGEPFAVEITASDFEIFIKEHIEKKQQTDIFVTNEPITYITVVPYEYNKYYV